MIRHLLLLAVALCGSLALSAAPLTDIGPVSSVPILLQPGQINNILITRGVTTVLHFKGAVTIDNVTAGSAIFQAKHDPELGRLFLKTRATTGATNMTITAGGVDYVFIVQITSDPSQVVYTRTYAFAGSEDDVIGPDLQRLGAAPKLKPADIDPSRLAKVILRIQQDPVYAQTMPDYRHVAIHRPYVWRNCIVHLLEADAFLDKDILVIKVEWVNTTGRGIYLNARQIGLTCPGKSIRVIASTQDSPDSFVLPGQLDTIWLVVQGERVGYMNTFGLTFPPTGGEAP